MQEISYMQVYQYSTDTDFTDTGRLQKSMIRGYTAHLKRNYARIGPTQSHVYRPYQFAFSYNIRKSKNGF